MKLVTDLVVYEVNYSEQTVLFLQRNQKTTKHTHVTLLQ